MWNGLNEIAAFWVSVFVTDRFLKEILAHPTTYLAARITKSALGGDSPVSNPTLVAQSNARGGLNICILHWGLPEFGAREETARIKSEITLGFLDLHKGYRVRNILVEAFGKREYSFYSNGGGFRHLSHSELLGSSHKSSNLLTLSRPEALAHEMDVLLPLFIYTPPRCFFSNGEQIVLNDALRGYTDEELMDHLFLSFSAIKKRWASIFEKFGTVLPSLLGHSLDRPPRKRGAQRRHVVLRYVRNHPEELRPYAKPSGTLKIDTEAESS